jgi:hypothetical protein
MYIVNILLIIIIIYLNLLYSKQFKEKFTVDDDNNNIIKSYIKELYLEDLDKFKKIKEIVNIVASGKLKINISLYAGNIYATNLICKTFSSNTMNYSGPFNKAPWYDDIKKIQYGNKGNIYWKNGQYYLDINYA